MKLYLDMNAVSARFAAGHHIGAGRMKEKGGPKPAFFVSSRRGFT